MTSQMYIYLVKVLNCMFSDCREVHLNMAEELSVECFEKLLEQEKIKMVSVCQESDCSFTYFSTYTQLFHIHPSIELPMSCRCGRLN